MPKIDAEANRYAQSIESRICYEPADMKNVADAVERLAKLPETEIATLRRQCRQTAQRRLNGKAYHKTFQTFVHAIQKMPRASPKSRRRVASNSTTFLFAGFKEWENFTQQSRKAETAWQGFFASPPTQNCQPNKKRFAPST